VPNRVYFQAPNTDLIEKCYDSKPWYTGAFSVPKALPRASLAAISFNPTSNISLRVYYSTTNDHIREKAWDSNSWYDGAFDVSGIPGSKVAAIRWGNVNIRVYFQKGTLVTGVTEWMWNGSGWSQGQAAIAPA
jgi:Fungal fucose-specific lectin